MTVRSTERRDAQRLKSGESTSFIRLRCAAPAIRLLQLTETLKGQSSLPCPDYIQTLFITFYKRFDELLDELPSVLGVCVPATGTATGTGICTGLEFGGGTGAAPAFSRSRGLSSLAEAKTTTMKRTAAENFMVSHRFRLINDFCNSHSRRAL